MGGGLLQRVHRDTMSFATKLCHIKYADGTEREVMKCPKTDTGKLSFPGRLAVREEGGVPTVYPAESVASEDNMLQVCAHLRMLRLPVHVASTSRATCYMCAISQEHILHARTSARMTCSERELHNRKCNGFGKHTH